MKAIALSGAEHKGSDSANARGLSPARATITQVLGQSGRFIFPALPAEFRSFMAAAKQLGLDPAELCLDAVHAMMEATIATAAKQNGRAA